MGGPIALIEDGDSIVIDLNADRLDCTQLNDDTEREARAARWREAAQRNSGSPPEARPVTNRLLARMRHTARPALEGAGMAAN